MIAPMSTWKYYTTKHGICINGDCEEIIKHYVAKNYEGKVQLILTSPPFPLKRAKKYGNKTGMDYLDWLCNIGNMLKPLLTETGSIVIEIGNAWNPGEPTYSTLPMETLIEFKRRCGLYLCQEFIYYNPARLPGPIEWVNKKRVRVKDSFRIPEMFMLLKYIRLTKATEKVFIAYSTPMEYEFQEEPFTSYRSYYGNLRTTDLLGYGGMSDDMAHSQLIVFIGFEGILSAKVNEDVRYAKLKLVNNIPSFYEKYKDISIINNYDLLATRHEKQAFVPADNPFETYNFLSELLDDEEAACIAPLSSKPVALGVCMYALDHENIRVVYPMAESYSPHRANSTHSTYMFEIKIN